MFKTPSEVGYGTRIINVNKAKDQFSFNIPKLMFKSYNLDETIRYHVYYNPDTGVISYVPEKKGKMK